MKPFDVAKDRMIVMADKLQQRHDIHEEGSGGGNPVTDHQQFIAKGARQNVVECRALQVDEVLGLEAMYNADDVEAENKELRIAQSSEFELLQQLVEQWHMDPEDEDTAQQIGSHPPPSFTIQLIVDGAIRDEDVDNGRWDGVELAAVLLLRVTLPSLYPLDGSSLPAFDVDYFVCTDRDMDCAPDKPLESLAHLDETKLKEALAEEARHMLPDPCVYHVVHACLRERLFEFVNMSVQGRHLLGQYRGQNMSGAKG